MLDVLRELILDAQEMPLDTGIPRHLDVRTVPGKATVCIGVRRSGKSTFMLQLMSRLLDDGVPRENILHLNFFDDRLHALRHSDLGVITEAYFSLYPEKKNTETIYCFFDEVQVLPHWEPFVDRLMRTEQSEVYITGSSAQMLSREVATQMRGRALSWEIFPFSFEEFMEFHDVDHSEPLSTRKRLAVQKAFEHFWEAGGFPEVAGLDRRLRTMIHQEYLNTVLFRDLVERHDISHPQAVADLTHRLIDNVASLQTANSLTGYLKSLGHKISRNRITEYLAWLEDAFFIYQVRLFDASLSRSNVNPKKIYCVDHALAASAGSGILVNTGHLLENLIFSALRRITAEIFYYRTGNGKEVDFVAQVPERKRMLIQVCESMVDQGTRSREVAAISEAMTELGLAEGTIVTRNENDQLAVTNGVVNVVPAWRFLLSLSSEAEKTS
ncbi:ATP-binding protein [Actinobacteria bacterium YIM 96077]|uniref:ATP-binding protein n=1 Tax=Phytoactinopolyspora halophila TaxID=1981511 RepID=A0A329QJV6_9ACTN|nr:ATP-binding protein [Phytoactinopolyspora halophila]AYY12591.1 ATP-binding protein [Actinobacteria bacterium YIM 96077]RAW12506.1 ATP-binding protein [Phytoactinopolyspora halophila]